MFTNEHLGVVKNSLKHVRAIQIELEFESVGFKGEGGTEVLGEKPLGARGKTSNKLNPHYGVNARIRTRATMMGGEREIRLLKEQDEGVKNTCSSSRIHFLWLFLLVDELPNESVERNSQINTMKINTMKPLLSGHNRDLLKYPLNRGCKSCTMFVNDHHSTVNLYGDKVACC